MLASCHTGAVTGIQGQVIRVEVDSAPGFPGLFMVGLPDSAVRESESRIKASLRNCAFDFSWDRRITVNLAPAHLRKTGSAFDLAIAVALLSASGHPMPDPAGSIFLGELALDGAIRPVAGVLPVLIEARARGFRRAVVPPMNAREAGLVPGLEICGASSLLSAVSGEAEARTPAEPRPDREPAVDLDLADVDGQHLTRRALEIAAAGRHNLLMVGPPGSGKTMLARRLPGILPRPDEAEALEMTAIQSAAGLAPAGLVSSRPFRAPHHTASAVSLVGGGTSPRPGEISLAHGGVLFLDELPEFPRAALEALRQPLEEGRLTVSRARASLDFPARFQLVAAMNPCPCGYLGDPTLPCRCTPLAVARYQSRVSGPLLDRIDLVVDVPRPEVVVSTRASRLGGEPSAVVGRRVAAAAEFSLRGRPPRSEHGFGGIDLDPDAAQALESAARSQGLSLRAVHRVLRVARTIADLQATPRVGRAAVLEALMFRGALALTSSKIA